MKFFQREEQKNAGVVGPFLHGAQWSLDWPGDKEYDYRSWFLETLRNSSQERIVPHIQSLDFYAHEYFDGDMPAVEEMLKAGRMELANLTAIGSEDDQFAAAIRRRLLESGHPFRDGRLGGLT
jgi:hypothetical protein